MVVLSVMVSAAAPPISVSTLLTEPVLAALSSVRVLLPPPRSTWSLLVNALARVTVSSPDPPVTVAVLATVTVLPRLPKVNVSLPPPRSTLALESAPVKAMVSFPVPEIRVSTVLKVAELLPLPRVTTSDTGATPGSQEMAVLCP